MQKPRKRFPGETTEIEVLRFDQDLEYQSFRGLLTELEEERNEIERNRDKVQITKEMTEEIIESVMAKI